MVSDRQITVESISRFNHPITFGSNNCYWVINRFGSMAIIDNRITRLRENLLHCLREKFGVDASRSTLTSPCKGICLHVASCRHTCMQWHMYFYSISAYVFLQSTRFALALTEVDITYESRPLGLFIHFNTPTPFRKYVDDTSQHLRLISKKRRT